MQTSHRKFPPVSVEDVCVHGEEEKKSVAREGEQTISNCVFILFSSFFHKRYCRREDISVYSIPPPDYNDTRGKELLL